MKYNEANASAEVGKWYWDKAVIAWMTAIHIIAITAIPFMSVDNLIACGVMYFVTGCLGITLCFHRLLTHRTYSLPKWLERIFATCGVLALQGSPLLWVAHHRMHHAGSDTEKDPHDASRGFWYSHMIWLLRVHPFFDEQKIIHRFGRDITTDAYYRWLDKVPNQLLVQAVLGGLLYAIGGWSMVGWGVFVRLVLVYHTTWFVNSASHIWGYRNYEVNDLARNNWWVALLTWGEGWHNNHHALPNVAPAGHRWWEFDTTYLIISLLRVLGLAKNVKTLKTEAQDVEDIKSSGLALARMQA